MNHPSRVRLFALGIATMLAAAHVHAHAGQELLIYAYMYDFSRWKPGRRAPDRDYRIYPAPHRVHEFLYKLTRAVPSWGLYQNIISNKSRRCHVLNARFLVTPQEGKEKHDDRGIYTNSYEENNAPALSLEIICEPSIVFSLFTPPLSIYVGLCPALRRATSSDSPAYAYLLTLVMVDWLIWLHCLSQGLCVSIPRMETCTSLIAQTQSSAW